MDLTTIIDNMLNVFDWGLMASIMFLSYGILKLLHSKIFVIKISTFTKRFITFVIGALLSIAYHYLYELSFEKIIPTYLLSVVFYDFIIKEILKKLNVGYNKTK